MNEARDDLQSRLDAESDTHSRLNVLATVDDLDLLEAEDLEVPEVRWALEMMVSDKARLPCQRDKAQLLLTTGGKATDQ